MSSMGKTTGLVGAQVIFTPVQNKYLKVTRKTLNMFIK